MNKILLSIIFFFALQKIHSQEISGYVYGHSLQENKQPLTGVNIYWAGTTEGTTSDNTGFFRLHRHKHDHEHHKIVFSFIGYKRDTIEVHNKTDNLKVILHQQKNLRQVDISERRPGSHISRVNPVKTQIVSDEELSKAACCNLSESFETNASIDVSQTDAVTGAKQIKLLGLSGIYSQLMTENFPNYQGLATMYGLNYIPGSWMESIQISKGAASVINGYESVSGQINVEYKKPHTADKVFVNLYGNSKGKYEANLDISNKLNDNWSTMLFTHLEDKQAWQDKNDDGFIDAPLVKQHQFFNRWKYDSHEHLKSQFGVKYLDEQRTGGQVRFVDNDKGSKDSYYGIDNQTERFEFFSKAAYSFHGEAERSIALISNMIYHDQAGQYGLKKYTATQKSTYFNLIYLSKNMDKTHTFSTGLRFKSDVYEEHLDSIDLSRREFVSGAFAEYTWSPVKRFTFMSGLRGDYHSHYGFFMTPRFHLKYNILEEMSIRASAGKGYRSPNIISDNNVLLTSSRKIYLPDEPNLEEAWNYGLNLTAYYTLFNHELRMSAEYFRTDFKNQIIVDMESDPGELRLYNLNGKSYANYFLAELYYPAFNGFEALIAYRLNDVKMTISDKLRDKPLTSHSKALLNLSYKTPRDDNAWQFDFTAQYNSGGRIPSTSTNPEEYRMNSSFDSYTIFNAQVTKYFNNRSFYVGAENLADFRQQHTVIAADEPFGDYFDASMVWGPLAGRNIYAGLRFSIE